MTVTILIGDCRKVLRELPTESVHCVVTSPPYWGLRDYGIGTDVFGLEPSYQIYVEHAVEIFRDVRRVLRPDGTLWLNLGDSYASTPRGNKQTGVEGWKTSGLHGAGSAVYAKTLDASAAQKRNTIVDGLKPKDLCGIPWRVAFALQADGWWLRQDIIWSKPNPMPESVTDRCTKAHEYLFLLSKSERYYFDAEAIREDLAPWNPKWGDPNKPPKVGTRGGTFDVDAPDGVSRIRSEQGSKNVHFRDREVGRNKRSVWEIATAPFAEAHFATFPPALIEPCVLAGCPKGGTVLDPFFGAGTTGLVADRLGRNCIGIELNAEYAAMAERRIKQDAGMFAEVSSAIIPQLELRAAE
jgi:DNA modification methylase